MPLPHPNELVMNHITHLALSWKSARNEQLADLKPQLKLLRKVHLGFKPKLFLQSPNIFE